MPCVLLWNAFTVDWLNVGMWFGTFSALGGRMRLVHPLFVAQTTWFGIPDVCSAKGEWPEQGIQDHEVRNSNDV